MTPSDPLKMLQSGLSRLKLVFNGGGTGGLEFQEKEKCKIHPPAMRSLSVVNMRPETTRQLLSKVDINVWAPILGFSLMLFQI